MLTIFLTENMERFCNVANMFYLNWFVYDSVRSYSKVAINDFSDVKQTTHPSRCKFMKTLQNFNYCGAATKTILRISK